MEELTKIEKKLNTNEKNLESSKLSNKVQMAAKETKSNESDKLKL